MTQQHPAEASATPVRSRRRTRLTALARFGTGTLAAFGAGLAFAAFTDDARNDGNRATAADVTITADRAATSPLFDLSDWRPEAGAESRCLTVTNDGTIPLPLTFGLAAAPGGSGLAEHVDVTVERGSGTAATKDGACEGFTADSAVDLNGSAAGTGATLADLPAGDAALVPDGGPALDDAAGADRRAYRITWTLRDTEEAEGRSVTGVSFRWKAATS